MMKYILGLLIMLSVMPIFGKERTYWNKKNPNYEIVSFLAMDSISDYYGLDLSVDSWYASTNLHTTISGFISGSQIISPNDVQYLLLNKGTGETSDFLYEVRDSTNTNAVAFLYGGTPVTTSDTISQSTADMVNGAADLMDPLDSISCGSTTTHITDVMDQLTLEAGTPRLSHTSYAISFDQADPYASGYTTPELNYNTYYDANGNKLELIEDTDRGNMLVGFRYTSALNSETYTKFIAANN